MVKWLTRLYSCKTPPCTNKKWKSIDSPPPAGKRVLVKSKDGEINIGHLDSENNTLWIAFTLEIAGRNYKFNIKEPIEWKHIPK